jgi:SSS family solute:Na+ symporter
VTVHWVDLLIFVIYLSTMLGVGFYFMRRNATKEDYYVGSRSMSAGHIGLSVVATEVGGGFSIGLGGLGFAIGISGSWMLFTGLLGAWLSTIWLIPKIYPIARKHHFLSFPDALKHYYNARVAFLAGIISLIGYIGFTSSQILAGAKLASATIVELSPKEAILVMGFIAIVYTVLGGIKAVIYTDTIQWIILMAGMLFIGIPFGVYKLGGVRSILDALPNEFLSLTNITIVQIINWFITIVPIWFIGMTLYQRIYASRDQKTAIKAWRIAGLFEWPIMAFLGVTMGLLAKVAFEDGLFQSFGYAADQPIDPELGLPIFLAHILPVGLMGLMLSAYFSAIMSTADSCLMAASGNLMTDVLGGIRSKWGDSVRHSQFFTLIIGLVAVVIALQMEEVLSLMLHSYAIMVSGLFIPVMMMLFRKKADAHAALWSMGSGGFITLLLIFIDLQLPLGLDPIFWGISVSLISYLTIEKRSKEIV